MQHLTNKIFEKLPLLGVKKSAYRTCMLCEAVVEKRYMPNSERQEDVAFLRIVLNTSLVLKITFV